MSLLLPLVRVHPPAEEPDDARGEQEADPGSDRTHLLPLAWLRRWTTGLLGLERRHPDANDVAVDGHDGLLSQACERLTELAARHSLHVPNGTTRYVLVQA